MTKKKVLKDWHLVMAKTKTFPYRVVNAKEVGASSRVTVANLSKECLLIKCQKNFVLCGLKNTSDKLDRS